MNRLSQIWKAVCLLPLVVQCSNPSALPPTGSPWFEGDITYQYTYSSSSLNADSLAQLRPHTGIMRFKGADYQSEFLASDTSYSVYVSSINRGYGYTNQQANEYCEDYSELTDSIIHHRVYATDTTILGHSCKVLEFQTTRALNRYYVSTTTPYHPDSYRHHKAYNWSFIGAQAEGGIVLKVEHHFGAYTMIGIATAVNKHPNVVINTNTAIAFCTAFPNL